MGCLYDFLTVNPQITDSQVIGQDQNNIRLLLLRRRCERQEEAEYRKRY